MAILLALYSPLAADVLFCPARVRAIPSPCSRVGHVRAQYLSVHTRPRHAPRPSVHAPLHALATYHDHLPSCGPVRALPLSVHGPVRCLPPYCPCSGRPIELADLSHAPRLSVLCRPELPAYLRACPLSTSCPGPSCPGFTTRPPADLLSYLPSPRRARPRSSPSSARAAAAAAPSSR